MDSDSEDGTYEQYSFCPFKLEIIIPDGNLRTDTKVPRARSGHRIVADSGNVYSYGGFNPENTDSSAPRDFDVLFKELWKFNLASRTWVKLSTSGVMPTEVASHSAVLISNHLLAYGGTGVPFGTNSSNRVHVCNLDTLEWSMISGKGCLPMEQYGQAIAVDQNKLYTVGGTSGYEYSMEVHSFDLTTRTWELLTKTFTGEEPEPRYRHEIVIKDQKIYVFGGGTSIKSFGFKEIPVFDLKNNTWTTVAASESCPANRLCHGCVRMGDDVFISGGHAGNRIFSSIWKMNLETLQWEKLRSKFPKSVYFHAAAVSPVGQMFMFGGVTKISHRTNDLYSMWIKIPSLAVMSWQSILHYIPHIAQLNKLKLLELGIPIQFLNQIHFQKDLPDFVEGSQGSPQPDYASLITTSLESTSEEVYIPSAKHT